MLLNHDEVKKYTGIEVLDKFLKIDRTFLLTKFSVEI